MFSASAPRSSSRMRRISTSFCSFVMGCDDDLHEVLLLIAPLSGAGLVPGQSARHGLQFLVALFGQVKQGAEFGTVERTVFRGALNLDEGAGTGPRPRSCPRPDRLQCMAGQVIECRAVDHAHRYGGHIVLTRGLADLIWRCFSAQLTASTKATYAPVTEAVRVPPSA